MENVRNFEISKEMTFFLEKKRSQKEMDLTSAKMFLLLEYLGINFNDYEEIAFEFMLRYSKYEVRQEGKEITSVNDIKRRWKDFLNMYTVKYRFFETIKKIIELDPSDEIISKINEDFKEELLMLEAGHDLKSAKVEIKNHLLYRCNK